MCVRERERKRERAYGRERARETCEVVLVILGVNRNVLPRLIVDILGILGIGVMSVMF